MRLPKSTEALRRCQVVNLSPSPIKIARRSRGGTLLRSRIREKRRPPTLTQLFAKVTNITRLSGVTHSARIFSAPDLPIRPANANGKSKVVTEEANEANPTLDEDVPVGRFTKKGEGLGRKEVSLEEANEFLHII